MRPATNIDPQGQKEHLVSAFGSLTGASCDALFSHLTQQWRDLFNARYDVILYDLTSTYFESDPPENCGNKTQFGYSRDHRPDCVQIVIGLVVTPHGFPLGYEIFAGNTRDTNTLRTFLGRLGMRLPTQTPPCIYSHE